jgi:hypothetical protein
VIHSFLLCALFYKDVKDTSDPTVKAAGEESYDRNNSGTARNEWDVYTGCFKKSYTMVFQMLLCVRGHAQCFELS